MVIVRAHSQPHSPPHKHTHTQSHTRTMSRFAHLQCDHIANFHNFSAIGFYSNVVFLVSFLIFVARKISSFLGRSTLADADAFVCELVSHWSTIPIVLYLSHTLSTHFSNFKNLLSLSLSHCRHLFSFIAKKKIPIIFFAYSFGNSIFLWSSNIKNRISIFFFGFVQFCRRLFTQHAHN